MKLVVVLCGRQLAGKTTLAKWFAASFGAKVISITDPIREVTAKIWGLTDDQVNGSGKDLPVLAATPEDDDKLWTPRELMIRTSRAIKAVLGEDVWIKLAQARIEDEFEECDLIVIDGVRPALEVTALRDLAKHPCETDRAINWACQVLVVKVICTDDELTHDEIDTEIDQLEADVVIAAGRDPEGLGQTLMHRAMSLLQEILAGKPELIPVFDPGESVQGELAFPEPVITTHE